jgi:hypothetical protein
MDSTPSSPETAAASEPSATGFGNLARRITGWSANLLATALVLVAGVAVGRQVLDWWYESPPAPPALSSDADLPPETPGELRLWTSRGPMTLTRIVGERDAAIAAMREACKSITQQAERHRGRSLQRDETTSAGPGEQRFLEKLAKLTPVEQTRELDLFAPPGDVTMVVAVHRNRARIAAWSFALEGEPATWSCYTFGPAIGRDGP